MPPGAASTGASEIGHQALAPVLERLTMIEAPEVHDHGEHEQHEARQHEPRQPELAAGRKAQGDEGGDRVRPDRQDVRVRPPGSGR